MGIVVQKFGGTSLADTDKIKNVAKAVIKEKNNGNDVVVIVSAMGHTTDYLVKLSSEISKNPNKREMDMLLSTGEQVSIALLTMAIQEEGYEAISLNASQVGIITENVHSTARIIDIKTDKLNKILKEGKIIVVAGFQGVTEDGEITTLGRGGSDTSAVAIAASLKADRCDIYTDVEGVYTTHPRAVETAKVYNVPLRVRSTFKLENLGTYIIGVKEMEINKNVTGVAADTTQVRIVICDVPDQPGNAGKVFQNLAKSNISVDMIIQSYARHNLNTNDIAFTVDENDLTNTLEILENVKKELNASNIFVDDDIAKVSIVGAGMIDHPGIASSMFNALAKADINIKMISTSEIKISCLVNKSDAKKAIQVLHSTFELGSDEIAEVKGDLPNFV